MEITKRPIRGNAPLSTELLITSNMEIAADAFTILSVSLEVPSAIMRQLEEMVQMESKRSLYRLFTESNSDTTESIYNNYSSDWRRL